MQSKRPPFLRLALFAAAYVLAGGFGQGLALIPGVAITFWPPAGIFLAALLLSQPRCWPWWIATACAAELTCNALWFHNRIPFALIYFSANALEAMTGAWLINRFAPKPFRLNSVEEAGWFVALCAGIAPIVGATVIATTDALLGKHPFAVAFGLVWLGDGSGLLVSAPLTLFAVRAWRERDRIPAWRFPEAALLLIGLIGAGMAALKGWLPSIYVLLPPLLWAAARFGLKGAAVALAVVTIMLAGFGAQQAGDSGGGPGLLQDRIVRLQTFLGVAAVCALFVGALSSQRQRAMAALRSSNRELEQRMEERTADLRVSEQRLRLAARSARFGVHDYDIAANACFWSEELYDICGIPRRTIVHSDLLERLIHPDDRPHIIPRIHAGLDPNGTGEFEAEFRIIRPDIGQIRWIENRCSTEFAQSADGTRLAVHSRGVVIDITDRKLAEQSLRANRDAFHRLVKGSPFGVYLVDADFRLAEVSAGAAQVFAGVEPLIGRDFAEIMRSIWPEPFATQAIDIFRRTLDTGEPYVSENFIERRADRGREEAYDWRTERVTMPDGRFGVVCHFYDLTAQRRLEEELRRARDEAQAANAALSASDRKKDEFLATLAHELRNPLAPVMNSLELLNRIGSTNPPAVEAREMIHRQVTHLVRLVDDLLDLSRITQGRIQLRKQRIDLRNCVRQALELVQAVCRDNEQTLYIVLSDEPLYIEGDDARVTQVVGNLLTNACRYTPRGGKIEVFATREGDEVVVKVRDTGIGIPPDKLEDIFEMFGQLERPMERTAGGLGIGLNLVRKLVQMHGGTVMAASEGDGRGSEFTVHLPACAASLAGAVPPPRVEVGLGDDQARRIARRILIADDNVDSAQSLAMLLKLNGHETRTAHDGIQALELAQQIQPDIVLLDIGMPRLNGYEACRAIRRALAGREPLMVAVSGWGQDENRRASAEAGFDQHLVKPVDFAKLQAILHSHQAPRVST